MPFVASMIGFMEILLANTGSGWTAGLLGAAGSWLLVYALVILAIGLGLIVVCRPTKRKKVEPED